MKRLVIFISILTLIVSLGPAYSAEKLVPDVVKQGKADGAVHDRSGVAKRHVRVSSLTVATSVASSHTPDTTYGYPYRCSIPGGDGGGPVYMEWGNSYRYRVQRYWIPV